MDDRDISLKEALDLCISRGMTRRQAKRFLMKHMRTGEVKATGVVERDGQMLGRQTIPPEFWDVPWTDTEGDKGE